MKVIDYTRESSRPVVVKLIDSAALSVSIGIQVVESGRTIEIDELQEIEISMKRLGTMIALLTDTIVTER